MAVRSFPSRKRPSGAMVVNSRITVLVHKRIQHSKYFKTRGTRTGIVQTYKTQRNRIYTRLGNFNIIIHSFMFFSFRNSLNTISIGHNEIITYFSRDVMPCVWLIPDLSEDDRAFIFRVKQFAKRRLFLHCLTVKMWVTLTQCHSLNIPKNWFFGNFARNPKSGSDMRPRASGTNSCSAVTKISRYRKQT
jgi:hypothetical protein